jgi:hypothetical protein
MYDQYAISAVCMPSIHRSIHAWRAGLPVASSEYITTQPHIRVRAHARTRCAVLHALTLEEGLPIGSQIVTSALVGEKDAEGVGGESFEAELAEKLFFSFSPFATASASLYVRDSHCFITPTGGCIPAFSFSRFSLSVLAIASVSVYVRVPVAPEANACRGDGGGGHKGPKQGAGRFGSGAPMPSPALCPGVSLAIFACNSCIFCCV